MSPSGIRDSSKEFWQCYGVRARLSVRNLREAIEHIRAIAGAIQVSHPITIVSPRRNVWRIAAWHDIEVDNAKPVKPKRK